MQTEQQRFHHKTRIRACGVLRRGDQLLCLNMHSPVTRQPIWTFPGGGVEVGESLHAAVQREFTEETGLTIEVGQLLMVNELIQAPFHALEFYFAVHDPKNTPIRSPRLGSDPENNSAYLHTLAFMSRPELKEKELTPDFFKDTFWESHDFPVISVY
jgi:8-oxo-dGTP diphosphatase